MDRRLCGLTGQVLIYEAFWWMEFLVLNEVKVEFLGGVMLGLAFCLFFWGLD